MSDPAYVEYAVTVRDPDTLRREVFIYLAEDSNDAWLYAQDDHPEYDVVSVRRTHAELDE